MRWSSAGLLVLASLALLLDTAAGFEILRLKKLAKLAIIGRALAPQIHHYPPPHGLPVHVPVPIPVPVHHHHHIISHSGHLGGEGGWPAFQLLHRGKARPETQLQRELRLLTGSINKR
ncbi:unnamed protein product [Ixodes hexagonus]